MPYYHFPYQNCNLGGIPNWQTHPNIRYYHILIMYVCMHIYIYIQFKSHYYVVFWVSSISTLAAHDKRVVSVKRVSLTYNGD